MSSQAAAWPFAGCAYLLAAVRLKDLKLQVGFSLAALMRVSRFLVRSLP